MMQFERTMLATLLGLSLALPAFATEVVEGEIGPGALYALYCPDEWNGNLILYCHGYIDAEAPVALPTADGIEPLRDMLLAAGHAVAYSSYSENGLAIKDGAQRTQQLRGIFTSQFGNPDRIFLMAHSLGSLVALKLVEQHPQHYDGALVMCGMIGGSRAEVDYIANLRILWDVFYPGVLPGSVIDVPPGLDLNTDVILPIITAIQNDPTGAVIISSVDQTPVAWSTPEQLVESFVRGLAFNIRGFGDVFDRTHDHSPVENSETVYTGLLPGPLLDTINAAAGRYESTVDADNYLENYYQPTGDLAIPVLTLHNDLDPVVPFFHETIYAQLVAEAGNADLLVQRVVPRYGHCNIEVDEMFQAFQDLVSWVDTGVAPGP